MCNVLSGFKDVVMLMMHEKKELLRAESIVDSAICYERYCLLVQAYMRLLFFTLIIGIVTLKEHTSALCPPW